MSGHLVEGKRRQNKDDTKPGISVVLAFSSNPYLNDVVDFSRSRGFGNLFESGYGSGLGEKQRFGTMRKCRNVG